MSAADFTAPSDTTNAAVIQNDDMVGETAPADDNAAMEAVWDRLVVSNGAERENGKFVSPDPDKRAAAEAAAQKPLEGGEGGEQQVDPSTVSTDVPLPANWTGKDALWAKLPPEAKAEIAELQRDQHAKFSDMGRKVAAFEPLHGVGKELNEYLGRIAAVQGDAYTGPRTPAEGISYLFNIQKQMDADAPGTLMQIMDTYGVRDKIAALLGVQPGAASAADTNTALLAKIDRLEAAIRQGTDPSKIEQVVDRREQQRQHDEEVSRLTSSKPLYKDIAPTRMVFFINEAWEKLGPTATKAAVFDHAYNAAVEADPALRAKSGAAVDAAKDAAVKAEAAKRGTSVNVRSTGTGKPRALSDDDAMEEVWAKHH